MLQNCVIITSGDNNRNIGGYMFNRKLVAISAAAMAMMIGFAPAVSVTASAEEVTATTAVTTDAGEDTVTGTAIKTSTKTASKKKRVKTAKKAPKKKAYKPVNAKHLTSSYKSKLAKQKKNWISVSPKNYSSRIKKEKKALIGISWNDLVKKSQVKLTPQGFDLMCRVVQCEAGDVRYTTKEMVAECIVNRARSYKGKDPITKALRAKGQFAVVRNGRVNTWDINGETVNAVKDALIKNSHPKSLKYFRNRYYFSWAKPYKSQDGTYFSLGR